MLEDSHSKADQNILMVIEMRHISEIFNLINLI